jgi:hypothetical protein
MKVIRKVTIFLVSTWRLCALAGGFSESEWLKETGYFSNSRNKSEVMLTFRLSSRTGTLEVKSTTSCSRSRRHAGRAAWARRFADGRVVTTPLTLLFDIELRDPSAPF